MRVCVFYASGQLLGRLQLQDSLQFPNAICAGVGRDGSDELYVSDNRAHCVKVFDYRGSLKRSIGGPGALARCSTHTLSQCLGRPADLRSHPLFSLSLSLSLFSLSAAQRQAQRSSPRDEYYSYMYRVIWRT